MLEEIKTVKELVKVLCLEKTVVYFLVEWSGPERASRMILNHIIESEKLKEPVYYIDYSDGKSAVLEEWISIFNEDETEPGRFQNFYGGWGSLAFVSKGIIVERIPYVEKYDGAELRRKLVEYCG